MHSELPTGCLTRNSLHHTTLSSASGTSTSALFSCYDVLLLAKVPTARIDVPRDASTAGALEWLSSSLISRVVTPRACFRTRKGHAEYRGLGFTGWERGNGTQL